MVFGQVGQIGQIVLSLVGVVTNLEPDLTFGDKVSILDTPQGQLSQTDVSYDAYVVIDDIENQFNLAGDYQEVINIVYTDY